MNDLVTGEGRVFCSGCKQEFEEKLDSEIADKQRTIQEFEKLIKKYDKTVQQRIKEWEKLSKYTREKIEIVLTRRDLQRIQNKSTYKSYYDFIKKHIHKTKVELLIELKPDKDYKNLCLYCEREGHHGTWGNLGFVCQACYSQEKIFLLMEIMMTYDRSTEGLNLDLDFQQIYLLFHKHFEKLREKGEQEHEED